MRRAGTGHASLCNPPVRRQCHCARDDRYLVPAVLAPTLRAAVGCLLGVLAVGNLATLVLDGGVKGSLIKYAATPGRGEERALLHGMFVLSLVLLTTVVGPHGAISRFYPALVHETAFVASFTGVHLLTYPWIGLPSASLERRLDYSRFAWIESAGCRLLVLS